jgi:hypothetical protein
MFHDAAISCTSFIVLPLVDRPSLFNSSHKSFLIDFLTLPPLFHHTAKDHGESVINRMAHHHLLGRSSAEYLLLGVQVSVDQGSH